MKRKYLIVIPFFLSCNLILFGGSAHSDERKELSMNNKNPAKVLVVVFSYTGNTKAVADDIIERFKADSVIIRAKRYDGFGGGMKASKDAWTEVITADIDPESVDMSQYNLIFLGSPIWWYRPAVPLWAFVDKNDFKGKPVVLFNTFNSKFKAKYISKFIGLVEEKNGRVLDHLYVRRGRWYAQLSREELLEKFNEILDSKEVDYNRIIYQGH
jgi:flavodoxin